MYGMETFWDGQVEMRKVLQVWINRGLRKILEAVRTMPVDAMLEETRMKRVEWELEKKVARWGYRLARGKENGKLAEEVKEKLEELGGERWEVESERMGKIG
ncbi:hypothetical protein C7212DRAFT_323886 [Tuber magnatum]|uniref:Uncharacterized protein n=1 Tax=Tuber magnatum TaxID=42249 RepID=A0A317SLK9_9PEZI|nr:hypothetical protein C7212DRAFT_323886 [Tuber magnatum]